MGHDSSVGWFLTHCKPPFSLPGPGEYAVPSYVGIRFDLSHCSIEEVDGVLQPIATLVVQFEGEGFLVHIGNAFRLQPDSIEPEKRTVRLRCACGETWGLHVKSTTVARRCVCGFRHKVTVQRQDE